MAQSEQGSAKLARLGIQHSVASREMDAFLPELPTDALSLLPCSEELSVH